MLQCASACHLLTCLSKQNAFSGSKSRPASNDESNGKKTRWFTCVGKSDHLSKFSHQCQYVLDEARLDNTKAEAFVVKAKEIALKTSDLAQELMKSCSFLIDNIRKKDLQQDFQTKLMLMIW